MIARMRFSSKADDSIDSKQILISSRPVDWKIALGRPRITWMKTVQNDVDSHKLD